MRSRRLLALNAVLVFSFLSFTIAVAYSAYPETNGTCQPTGGTLCSSMGETMCNVQGGGSCNDCLGGGALPQTTCVPAAGSAGCDPVGTPVYCGIHQNGDCGQFGGCINKTENGFCSKVYPCT
jgi:hypothetical protein